MNVQDDAGRQSMGGRRLLIVVIFIILAVPLYGAKTYAALESECRLTLGVTAHPANYRYEGEPIRLDMEVVNGGDVACPGPFLILTTSTRLFRCTDAAGLEPGAQIRCSETFHVDPGMMQVASMAVVAYVTNGYVESEYAWVLLTNETLRFKPKRWLPLLQGGTP
jgi:hypothetical protein